MVKAKRKKRHLLKALAIFIILAIAILLFHELLTTMPTQNPKSKNNQPDHSSKAEFSKTQYPTDKSSSLWVVVNKGRQLPSNYVPGELVVPNVALSESAASENMHLRSNAANAMEHMFQAASADNIKLMLVSGYRSYATQVSVYNGYVSTIGQAAADASSARPGHSEHQTGLAADVGEISRACQLDQCFETTAAGRWVAANAYKYGFIVRYQKGKDSLTGYEYEPWHLRYVGQALALQINDSDQTLEEFFGLADYPDYPTQSLILQN